LRKGWLRSFKQITAKLRVCISSVGNQVRFLILRHRMYLWRTDIPKKTRLLGDRNGVKQIVSYMAYFQSARGLTLVEI
jgi:hypothetical protein